VLTIKHRGSWIRCQRDDAMARIGVMAVLARSKSRRSGLSMNGRADTRSRGLEARRSGHIKWKGATMANEQ
jgi:hypothetical protein